MKNLLLLEQQFSFGVDPFSGGDGVQESKLEVIPINKVITMLERIH